MKKLIAMLLVLTMAMSLAACGASDANSDNANLPASALEILETVWGAFAEEEKFPVMGGDMNNMVDGAPGTYSLEDNEALTAQLLVPADQAANIAEAAALFHGMMLNNFTCGAFRMAEGADAAAFAETMYNAISTNPWMCGMPEKLIIATFGDEYVLIAFGLNDAINPFETKLTTAYPDAKMVYSEAITG